MRLPTFKAQYRLPPHGGSLPPRPVYEPISPELRPSEPAAVAVPAGANDIKTEQLSAALRHDAGSSVAQGGQIQSPPRLSLLPSAGDPPQPLSNPHTAPALRSPIDALANTAPPLGPSPAYTATSQRPSYGPISPVVAEDPRASKHAYPVDGASAYGEPPSKRARSEIMPSPQRHQQHQQHYSRPSTSHNPGWSYNVEQMADHGARMYHPHTEAPVYQQDKEIEKKLADAQLLLDFSIAVASPPVQQYIPTPTRSHPYGMVHAAEHYNMPATAPYYPVRTADYPPPHPPFDHRTPAHNLAPNASPAPEPPSLAVQTHTPPDDPFAVVTQPRGGGEGEPVEEKKPKKHHGWPKGKPRGPRNGVATEKKKKSTSKAANVITPLLAPEQLHTPQSLPIEAHDDVPIPLAPALDEPPVHALAQTPLPIALQPRRLSDSNAHPPEASGPSASSTSPRAQSVPASANMGNNLPPINIPTPAAQGAVPESSQTTICAGCNSSDSATSIGDGEQWISCDGCKGWFHYACAGFKSEREVRLIDKFYCDGCRPKFGNTTKLRKSSRAHTAVDYAGLNEGIMKTSDDNPEHHYIQAFKNGDITFTPETFARLPPECATADFIEKMNGFTEPVVIPGALNPRPQYPHVFTSTPQPPSQAQSDEASDEPCPQELVPDDGQDMIDMIIPAGLTVRRVAELYGPNEKVPVIDVKTQDGMNEWTMGKWADYYEQQGEKPVRNVISLEVSRSKLGRLIRRPKLVRDMDLQDSVWRAEDKNGPPAVGFYCLMSVADCYTDFHIDFGGSSVYYHIIKGQKTFFFIPPTKHNLKKYEDWCLSPKQSQEFLGHQVKECYRVDLYPGDTALIPSGWIHAVWTPTDSLVIGGNYLTRLHYGMQIKVLEIEKSTKIAPKFRYPYFQKIMWLAAIKYLEDDPLPASVEELLLRGGQFERSVPIYCEPDKFGHNSDLGPENYHQRYYPKAELEGLSDLVTYIWRTVMISLGRIDGIPQTTRNNVTRSIPKGFGEPSILARRFAMWVAWKKGNEKIPAWALPDPTLQLPDLTDKSISSAQAKKMERESWNETLKLVRGGERHSSLRARVSEQPVNGEPRVQTGAPVTGFLRPHREHVTTPKTSQLGPKRIACDACRKRRIRCKHKDELVESPQSGDSGSGRMNIPASSSPPTTALGDLAVRRCSGGDISTAPLPFGNPPPYDLQGSVNGGPISADMSAEALANKSGRVKACADCRKSKRRCIHDENGNVDPVKAAEAPVPRGSASKKRRPGDDDDGEALTKKMRMESFAGLLQDGEVSHWNRYPLTKPRPRSETASRENAVDFTVDEAYRRGSMDQVLAEGSHQNHDLVDGDGDAIMTNDSHPLPAESETVLTSIENHHGEPMDGIETDGHDNINQEPQTLPQTQEEPADDRPRTPDPRTPPPVPIPNQDDDHNDNHDSTNGITVHSPSPVSPHSPVKATPARNRPLSTSPNWTKSSRISVKSWNGTGTAKTPPSAIGKGRRGSKDGLKMPRSEGKIKPRAMSSTTSRRSIGREGPSTATMSSGAENMVAVVEKQGKGKGKKNEDMASIALALQLQMEEHGLRRRSK